MDNTGKNMKEILKKVYYLERNYISNFCLSA